LIKQRKEESSHPHHQVFLGLYHIGLPIILPLMILEESTIAMISLESELLLSFFINKICFDTKVDQDQELRYGTEFPRIISQ
jgi:hypothetical protein